MLEFIAAGGWLMLPILLCSIIASGIIVERFLVLRPNVLTPKHLVREVLENVQQGKIDREYIKSLRNNSALGRILAAGLIHLKFDRVVMKERIEEMGRQVAHDLEDNLNILGIIASITPLIGLLGTVIGMIDVFDAITQKDALGDPQVLAGGISTALITTASGLCVAIPSLAFHRYFLGRVDMIILRMEENAMKMVEIIHDKGQDL